MLRIITIFPWLVRRHALVKAAYSLCYGWQKVTVSKMTLTQMYVLVTLLTEAINQIINI